MQSASSSSENRNSIFRHARGHSRGAGVPSNPAFHHRRVRQALSRSQRRRERYRQSAAAIDGDRYSRQLAAGAESANHRPTDFISDRELRERNRELSHAYSGRSESVRDDVAAWNDTGYRVLPRQHTLVDLRVSSSDGGPTQVNVTVQGSVRRSRSPNNRLDRYHHTSPSNRLDTHHHRSSSHRLDRPHHTSPNNRLDYNHHWSSSNRLDRSHHTSPNNRLDHRRRTSTYVA